MMRRARESETLSCPRMYCTEDERRTVMSATKDGVAPQPCSVQVLLVVVDVAHLLDIHDNHHHQYPCRSCRCRAPARSCRCRAPPGTNEATKLCVVLFSLIMTTIIINIIVEMGDMGRRHPAQGRNGVHPPTNPQQPLLGRCHRALNADVGPCTCRRASGSEAS